MRDFLFWIDSTCCETLDREEPLRRRVSPWHTVSKELGRMERKSLKERRWATSASSAVGTIGATGRGNSLDSSGSSVLLYRPNALATPSRVGTVYLHRYSLEEKKKVKIQGETVSGRGVLCWYLCHGPLEFCKCLAGPA